MKAMRRQLDEAEEEISREKAHRRKVRTDFCNVGCDTLFFRLSESLTTMLSQTREWTGKSTTWRTSSGRNSFWWWGKLFRPLWIFFFLRLFFFLHISVCYNRELADCENIAFLTANADSTKKSRYKGEFAWVQVWVCVWASFIGQRRLLGLFAGMD